MLYLHSQERGDMFSISLPCKLLLMNNSLNRLHMLNTDSSLKGLDLDEARDLSQTRHLHQGSEIVMTTIVIDLLYLFNYYLEKSY